MSHSHWPTRFPQSRTHRHDMPKAECDRLWREYQHGHVGVRCVMEEVPGLVKPRCALDGATKRDAKAEQRAAWDAEFVSFAAQEAERIARGGPPV